MRQNVKKSTKVATKSTKKVASKSSKKATVKSQVAKAAQAEVKNTFIMRNIKFVGNESIINVGESRDVKLTFVDEDNFLAIERAKRPADGPSQKRTTLDRTAHGKLSVDGYGAHVYFYFPFTEFDKNTWLADALESEAELMGDRIVEMEAIC